MAASLQAPKLFTIAQDLNHVQIEAQVDEADIGQVTSSNAVSFSVDAYPDTNFNGTVEQIRLASTALANVVTYTVVIGADNPHGRLLPGMTANVEIVTGENHDVVLVPNEALRFQPRGPAEALIARRRRNRLDAVGRGSRRPHRAHARAAEGRARPRSGGDRQGARRRRSGVRGAAAAGTPALARARKMPASRRGMRVGKVLRAVLSPEQYKKYEELQRARPSGQRFGTIWTLEAGRLVPRRRADRARGRLA